MKDTIFTINSRQIFWAKNGKDRRKNIMKRQPLISVIIPAYNTKLTIERAIKSVLSQTYQDYEIIVVDDGSTDKTAECIRHFDSTIKYLHQENQGVSAARNAGVAAADGKWIAFLDADDEWHPNKLNIQMKYIISSPNIIFVSTKDIYADQGENQPFPSFAINDSEYSVWQQIAILRKNKINTSSVLLKRDIFNKVGGFDVTLLHSEDRDLWLKVLYQGKGIHIPLPLTKSYRLPDSLSSKTVRRSQCQIKIIDKWDNRRSDTLDTEKKIPLPVFRKIKYSVLYQIIYKLIASNQAEAKTIWRQFCIFSKQEFPLRPRLPWRYFLFRSWLRTTLHTLKLKKKPKEISD
jgi:glycosyltransferase involved in cell wall biosynthesis